MTLNSFKGDSRPAIQGLLCPTGLRHWTLCLVPSDPDFVPLILCVPVVQVRVGYVLKAQAPFDERWLGTG